MKKIGINKLVPDIATAGFVWDEGLCIDVICEPTLKSTISLQIKDLKTNKIRPNIDNPNDDAIYYWQALGRSPSRYFLEDSIEQFDVTELKIQLLDIRSMFGNDENFYITNRISYKDAHFLLEDFRSWGFQEWDAGWMRKNGTIRLYRIN